MPFLCLKQLQDLRLNVLFHFHKFQHIFKDILEAIKVLLVDTELLVYVLQILLLLFPLKAVYTPLHNFPSVIPIGSTSKIFFQDIIIRQPQYEELYYSFKVFLATQSIQQILFLWGLNFLLRIQKVLQRFIVYVVQPAER